MENADVTGNVKRERDDESDGKLFWYPCSSHSWSLVLSDAMDMSAPLDDDLDNIVLSDDEAEQELQAALARARQLQQVEAKKVGVEKVRILLRTGRLF